MADSLFVFIVPINTTLSTMDKMLSLFLSEINATIMSIQNDQNQDKKQEINLQNLKALMLCLITIGPKENTQNIYWKKDDADKNKLIPKKVCLC